MIQPAPNQSPISVSVAALRPKAVRSTIYTHSNWAGSSPLSTEREGIVKQAGSDNRLSRVVAIINGKGGSGKTSLTANIAGQAAREAVGYNVLAVDLDLQGNLGLDLGYAGDADRDDEGRGIVEAVSQGVPLAVTRGVRTRLDVIPGGAHLEMLPAIEMVSVTGGPYELEGGSVQTAFAARLAEIAAGYDLILLDCAPGNPVLQQMALAAARHVLIPTTTDAAGLDGLRMVGRRVKKAQQINPELDYIGAILFGHPTNATRIRRQAEEQLAAVADRVSLFTDVIRHSKATGDDCRLRGQLAHELARDAEQSASERLSWLRTKQQDRGIRPAALAEAAGSLAQDYWQVTYELLSRINAREEAAEAVAGAS